MGTIVTLESQANGGVGVTERTPEEMLSIPLRDGTRLQIGECFTVSGCYPFFSNGHENYNAQLLWDDHRKSLWYDIYRVSERVRGCACGGSVGKDDIDWSKIVRRADRQETEAEA